MLPGARSGVRVMDVTAALYIRAFRVFRRQTRDGFPLPATVARNLHANSR